MCLDTPGVDDGYTTSVRCNSQSAVNCLSADVLPHFVVIVDTAITTATLFVFFLFVTRPTLCSPSVSLNDCRGTCWLYAANGQTVAMCNGVVSRFPNLCDHRYADTLCTFAFLVLRCNLRCSFRHISTVTLRVLIIETKVDAVSYKILLL